MLKFEVGIYNQQVREMVAEGDSHEHYDDEWGDLHFLEVFAENEDQARVQVHERHPTEHGFVIESVEKMGTSKFE